MRIRLLGESIDSGPSPRNRDAFQEIRGVKYRTSMKVASFLVEMEPHFMPYVYASKTYRLPVPWLYAIVSSSIMISANYGGEGEHTVTYQSGMTPLWARGTRATKKSPLWSLPFSNSDGSGYCGGKHVERKIISQKEAFELETDLSVEPIELLQRAYVAFTSARGNNDYRFWRNRGPYWQILGEGANIHSGWAKLYNYWSKLSIDDILTMPSSMAEVEKVTGHKYFPDRTFDDIYRNWNITPLKKKKELVAA